MQASSSAGREFVVTFSVWTVSVNKLGENPLLFNKQFLAKTAWSKTSSGSDPGFFSETFRNVSVISAL